MLGWSQARAEESGAGQQLWCDDKCKAARDAYGIWASCMRPHMPDEETCTYAMQRQIELTDNYFTRVTRVTTGMRSLGTSHQGAVTCPHGLHCLLKLLNVCPTAAAKHACCGVKSNCLLHAVVALLVAWLPAKTLSH